MTLALAALAMAACDGSGPARPRISSPTQPQIFVPTPTPAAQAAQLLGRWKGSTRVATIEGLEPDCLPDFLERGFTDVLTAEIFTQGGPNLLYLEQDAIGGRCHFNLSAGATSISATPYGTGAWDYDACQVEIDISSSSCSGPEPEVWISGILLDGTFTDGSRNRIEGSLEVRYQHRADDTQPFAEFIVTEELTLAKVPE